MKIKSWLAAFMAFLLSVALVCTAGAEFDEEDLADLEAPLCALIAVKLDAGLSYPADGDEISSRYAEAYLFYMANIYHQEDGAPLDGAGDGFELYAEVSREEAQLLIKQAFGGLLTVDDIEGDGEEVIVGKDALYVGLGDGYRLEAAYAGEAARAEDGAFPYDFTLTFSDGGEQTGRAWVTVDKQDDPDAPLCVTGIELSVEADAGSLAGNWKSEDGWWCSLMEEGLIFCFNAEDAWVADGRFETVDGALSVTLGEGDAHASYDGESLTLTVGATQRAYARAN